MPCFNRNSQHKLQTMTQSMRNLRDIHILRLPGIICNVHKAGPFRADTRRLNNNCVCLKPCNEVLEQCSKSEFVCHITNRWLSICGLRASTGLRDCFCFTIHSKERRYGMSVIFQKICFLLQCWYNTASTPLSRTWSYFPSLSVTDITLCEVRDSLRSRKLPADWMFTDVAGESRCPICQLGRSLLQVHWP